MNYFIPIRLKVKPPHRLVRSLMGNASQCSYLTNNQ